MNWSIKFAFSSIALGDGHIQGRIPSDPTAARAPVTTMPSEAFPVSDGGKKFQKAVGSVLSMAPHAASKLEVSRQAFMPSVPPLLLGPVKAVPGSKTTCVANEEAIKARFPNLFGQPIIDLAPADGPAPGARAPLRVGCVLSGGQAAGGHNCICGLFDYLNQYAPGSKVQGLRLV